MVASAVQCAVSLVPGAIWRWVADFPGDGIELQPRRTTTMFTLAPDSVSLLSGFSLFGKGFAGLAVQFEPHLN